MLLFFLKSLTVKKAQLWTLVVNSVMKLLTDVRFESPCLLFIEETHIIYLIWFYLVAVIDFHSFFSSASTYWCNCKGTQ